MAAASSTSPDQPDAAQYELFVRLFAIHNRQIFAYIQSLLPTRTHAEEVFQNTSMVMWRECSSYRPEGDFVRWACAIAFNQVRNYRRKIRGDRLVFDDDVIARIGDHRLRRTDLDQRAAALARCIESLRESDRDLIQRCYGSTMKFSDVAREVGRPVNTVYKALNRIRATLMQCIDREVRSGVDFKT